MTAQVAESVIHNTFVIERKYPQPPAGVYASFAQPARKRRWYVESENEIQEFEMEFRVGGNERLRYRFKEGHPIAGSEIVNESTYQDIVPEMRIVMTTRMQLNGKAISIMLSTFEFRLSDTGTELVLTHQGTYIEWPAGAHMIEEGWRALLTRLERELAR